MLLSLLLTREMVRGLSMVFFAHQWALNPTSVASITRSARLELAYRVRKAKPADRRKFTPPIPSCERLQIEHAIYEPLMAKLEQDAVADLADVRVEKMIRGMFTEAPSEIFCLRRQKTARINEAPTPRKPRGRPKGSKNKPKPEVLTGTGGAWPMPAGVVDPWA